MASSSLAFQPRSIYQRPEEDVLLSYEAEEERIPNVLYQKLERLREEKQGTQNDRERDQHIDRLTRQIARLESQPMLLEAMRAENAQLRTRVTDLERDFLRVSRVNEIYRQELLEHRRRLGLPYESLIGLGSSASGSISSSPVETRRLVPATSAVPIPRNALESAPDSTPPSSPSYSLSPTQPFFPSTGSQFTTLTTPSSAPPPPQQPLNGVLSLNGALNELATQRSNLTYPSVPPPSLASSLGSGSPVVVRRRAGSAIEDELEEIDEAYSDEEVLEDDEDELGRRFVGLEIGRRIGGVELGDGVGRGPLDIRSSRGGGLGLSGPR
ncbi:hypothetical protein RHS01_09419 [Rhizoctonia solani]|uniref:Uncharacterized protein n=1 Tax=Rhizoctonia solani TaxID=456999 RepID=A0A8H7I3P9_9AGAM|nr:hypothetical protein RHS01_09419 [Rhizoctonia solani]